MPYDLSAEQQQAIHLRGSNILVAAGAGSGKTTVLVERVLAHLSGEQPGSIDRLLVLTFTNAAAAEMRARIEEALAEQLRLNPDDAHLTRQLALAQQAPITTIHAFCLDTVRRNFYRLGLDAGFRIPTELERVILHEETLAAFLEREYEKEDGQLSALADCYGGRRDDSGLARLIGDLYDFSRSQPYPEAWLKEAAQAFTAPGGLDSHSWSAFLLRELRQELALARRALDEACSCRVAADVPPAWLAQAQAEAEAIGRAVAAGGGLVSFFAALSALSFANLPRGGKEWDEAAKEEFRRRRDEAKNAVYCLQKRYGRRDPQDMQADLLALAPLMERLCQLARDYGAALDAEKRRRNLLDFDDMEHFCLQLLEETASDVAAELRASFDELLIDEYQDINAVQERILRLLARGDNFFAVGDVKQSIYRFRLAEPALFLQKYQEYGQGRGGARVDLNRNYRSSRAVIAAVNFLFRQLMSADSAELDYDQAAELKAGRPDAGAAAELWLVERAEAEEEIAAEAAAGAEAGLAEPAAEALPEPALAAEARLLGKRILELHGEGYAFSDMAVLLRAAKNREALLAQEFMRMGIPALAASRPDYLQTAEISLMLSLLAIIDNPLQELELAAVLRSPLFDFSLDELAEIRFAAPSEQLLRGLEATAQGQGELAEKCRLFLAQLTGWRQALRCRRVSELMEDIYRETGLLQLAGAMPAGGQRQENLLLLQQQAREYEAGSYRGLFRFLLFLADGRGKAAPGGSALAEGEEAVRVMSIHRSKGLEFPVVLVANLGGAFSLADERQDVIWHKELGLGPKVVERGRRRKFPSLAQEAVARRLHKEALAEEMRVLYVALTRARERLILSASVKDIVKTAAAWYQAVAGQGPVLAGELLLRDKRPLDWLGQALLRHPDAVALREAAGIAPGSAAERQLILADGGHWQINIVPKSALPAPEQKPTLALPAQAHGQALPASPDKAAVEAVLSYRYPYAESCAAAAKWTVTELNRQNQLPPAALAEEAAQLLTEEERPAARQSGEAAARRGLAQHKMLQYLNFANAASGLEVERQLAALVERGLCSAEEAALVETEQIARFAASDLGRRMAVAARSLREAPFTYALPARELLAQAAAGDKLVLQGMIDAAFWEEGGWVLLDYKTGGHGLAETQLQERYARQIGYYCRALQDIWQGPVKEAWLCFIDLDKNILMRNAE